MYTVYMHECPNGKRYIGVTNKSLEERSGRNGIQYNRNKYFYEDIMKYGWDNISHSVLFVYQDRKEAVAKEYDLIEFYETRNPEKGYNHVKGSAIHSHTSETKQKMSRTRKGISPSEEHRKHLSESLKGRKLSEHQRKIISERQKGTHLTEEHKRKISEGCKGKGTKVVVQMDLFGNEIKRFNSAGEAMKEVQPSRKKGSNIALCCKGSRPTAYGFKWKYAE